MKEIGEKLKKAREKKQLSLKDIQEATKIRFCYLEAIESGELEIIPGEVYRKGFISNYANAVGLDAEELMREYQQLKSDESPGKTGVKTQQKDPAKAQEKPVKTSPVKKAVNQPTASGSRAPMLKRKVILADPGRLRALIATVVILLVGFFVFGAFKNLKLKNTATLAEKSTKTVNDAGFNHSESSKQAKVTRAKLPSKRSGKTVEQIFPAPITVYAEFSQNVWLQVKADGKVKYLDDGVTFTAKSPKQLWTANSEMIIRTGNPAGMKLVLNGKDLGTLGEEEVAKTFVLTVKGMEESKDKNWR